MRLGRFRYLFENRALVLMYHRISTPVTDPWDLSVSPGNFEDHLIHLKQNFNIVSAEELAHHLETGKIPHRSVVLTFDDGYLDNYLTAKPILEKHSIPACFFITDSYLGSGQTFWWDELESVVVHSGILPRKFSLSYRDETIHFDLSGETELTGNLKQLQAGYKYNKLPTLRTQLYMKLWHLFSPLRKDEQLTLLRTIREWAESGAGAGAGPDREQSGTDISGMDSNDLQTGGKMSGVDSKDMQTGGKMPGSHPRSVRFASKVTDKDRNTKQSTAEYKAEVCMSPDQVKEISENPLFTIGGHTCTHPFLSEHSRDVQFSEISENRQYLQDLTGMEISLFAYPSGRYNTDTIDILRDIGYKAAFTTTPGVVSGRTDRSTIKRFQVTDMKTERFKMELEKWIRS